MDSSRPHRKEQHMIRDIIIFTAGVITGAAGLFGISYLISPKVEELEDLFEEMSDGEP